MQKYNNVVKLRSFFRPLLFLFAFFLLASKSYCMFPPLTSDPIYHPSPHDLLEHGLRPYEGHELQEYNQGLQNEEEHLY